MNDNIGQNGGQYPTGDTPHEDFQPLQLPVKASKVQMKLLFDTFEGPIQFLPLPKSALNAFDLPFEIALDTVHRVVNIRSHIKDDIFRIRIVPSTLSNPVQGITNLRTVFKIIAHATIVRKTAEHQ